MNGDKRRSPRLYRRFILRAAAFGEQPLRWSFVTIHNLSSGGILFTYDRPVYEGMLLYFKIDFPDKLIECMGKVVRVGGIREGLYHDVAAQLEGIKSDDRMYVENFVRQNLV
jgi:hypothetical protein